MSKLKTITGATVEHWLDRRLREHKPIHCQGNFIRIPAAAWVEFLKIKNSKRKNKQSLFEANRDFERRAAQNELRENNGETA